MCVMARERRAVSKRARVCALNMSAALVKSPVAVTSHPSGTVIETS
jgi:hypothetical protein